jgi:phenylpyruvate tautomerase
MLSDYAWERNLILLCKKENPMPLIELDTSCDLKTPERRQELAKQLSGLAAQGIGKPEQYVMACVRDNVAMSMSGTSEAAALVSVKSIGGLSREVNQKLAKEISGALQAELGIGVERIYLTFTELPPSHWGWNAGTFG